jgi:hypothetical protein
VAIVSELAQVVDPQVNLTAFNRLSHEREPQRLKILRENRDDINTHG